MKDLHRHHLLEFLDQHAIACERFDHLPAFTVLEGLSFISENPGIEFLGKIPKLFLDSFSMDIAAELQIADDGTRTSLCRFTCPFIQKRLYNALTDDLIGDRLPILAVEPLDDLEDVFAEESLNLPSLLNRYKKLSQNSGSGPITRRKVIQKRSIHHSM